MVMIMKQFLLFILAGCIVLFSACQSDISSTESLETEPTFLDASWQKVTDSPQSEETIAETKSANEERSDETPPEESVCTVPTKPVANSTNTDSADDSDRNRPMTNSTEYTKPTAPKEDVWIPSTEATEATTPIPMQTLPPVTEPPATEPIQTISETTEPIVTEPPVTEPQATELEVEEIDTAALESYGRSYASNAYGYNGTSACNSGSGAGYFPAATKEITSMEEGYRYVQQAIDSQYNRDMAYGYLPYEEIDGAIVRCPINVSVTSAGGNTYTITVYYGGTA